MMKIIVKKMFIILPCGFMMSENKEVIFLNRSIKFRKQIIHFNRKFCFV